VGREGEGEQESERERERRTKATKYALKISLIIPNTMAVNFYIHIILSLIGYIVPVVSNNFTGLIIAFKALFQLTQRCKISFSISMLVGEPVS
jgi:uncharacterized membrane protein